MQAHLLAVLAEFEPERSGVTIKLSHQNLLNVRRHNLKGMVAHESTQRSARARGVLREHIRKNPNRKWLGFV